VFLLLVLMLVPLVNAEYSADATATKRTINLGESVSISGSVKEDSFPFSDGFAFIEIVKEDSIVYRLPSFLTNGEFRSTVTFLKDDAGVYLTPGEYHTNIVLQDFFGNELKVFSNILTITVSNELIITADVAKIALNPGEAVKINGNVKAYYGTVLTTGVVKVVTEDSAYDVAIENGLFTLAYSTKSDAKAGNNEIELSVRDDNGNNGVKTLNYMMNSVPTTLIGNLEEQSYAPKDTLTLNPKLFDQAGDLLEQEVDVIIKKPSGEIELSKKALTGKAFTYIIPDYATPGSWQMLISYGGLKEENVFEVETVQDVNIELDGQTLLVTNVGNVPYTRDIQITLRGKQDYTLSKKSNLQPGETVPLDLFKDVEDGVYEVSAQGFVFPSVEIIDTRKVTEKSSDFFKGVTGRFVGSSGSNTSWKPVLWAVFGILLLGGFIFLYKTQKVSGDRKRRERDAMMGQKRVVEIRKEKENSPVKSKYSFGVANKEEIEDYKKRVLKDIEQQKQEPPKRNYSFERPLERKRF